jgi:hypothetical protein
VYIDHFPSGLELMIIEIDTLEQQHTEKIESKVKDVDRIRISYASSSRVAFWGIIRALQSDINICYPPPQTSSPPE